MTASRQKAELIRGQKLRLPNSLIGQEQNFCYVWRYPLEPRRSTGP